MLLLLTSPRLLCGPLGAGARPVHPILYGRLQLVRHGIYPSWSNRKRDLFGSSGRALPFSTFPKLCPFIQSAGVDGTVTSVSRRESVLHVRRPSANQLTTASPLPSMTLYAFNLFNSDTGRPALTTARLKVSSVMSTAALKVRMQCLRLDLVPKASADGQSCREGAFWQRCSRRRTQKLFWR